MSKVSTELSARARNEVSRVLQAIAASNQSQLAEQLGIDPSTLSRMKNDKKSNGLTELENCLVLLDILGFKTVLKKYRMISEEKLNALFVMSKAWMESKSSCRLPSEPGPRSQEGSLFEYLKSERQVSRRLPPHATRKVIGITTKRTV